MERPKATRLCGQISSIDVALIRRALGFLERLAPGRHALDAERDLGADEPNTAVPLL